MVELEEKPIPHSRRPLPEGLKALQDQWVAEAPVKYQKLYRRVLDGKGSPRECIKLKCLDCVGYCRKEVEHCTSVYCALYQLRPFKKPVEDVAAYHAKSGLRLPDRWPRKASSSA
jgi:hypothetical protein